MEAGGGAALWGLTMVAAAAPPGRGDSCTSSVPLSAGAMPVNNYTSRRSRQACRRCMNFHAKAEPAVETGPFQAISKAQQIRMHNVPARAQRLTYMQKTGVHCVEEGCSAAWTSLSSLQSAAQATRSSLANPIHCQAASCLHPTHLVVAAILALPPAQCHSWEAPLHPR